MRTRGGKRLVIEQHDYESVRPYIEQLMDGQNHSQTQSHDNQSTELYSSSGTEVQENEESVNSEARKVCGPTLLKDIWKLPPGKKIAVQFNNHYKSDLKSEYLEKYKTKDALLKNRPASRIPRDQWTGLVSYWLSDKAKRRTQANRNNRAKQNMPHTGGSKSIDTLMDEQDMMNERLRDTDGSNDQPPRSVAWEGDVYSQVLENDKSGYVRGLGLGPTPSMLWGSRSSLGNIVIEDSSDEVVQKLKHEITELKELNEKQNEEMSFIRQELSWMRQVMRKIAPNELPMPQNINGVSTGQATQFQKF
ncbi:uncharacterized protein LOC107777534 [Nicotiana tabacum]|uniref:Uncharacterized protein LOC107777534 n=1 Tax=Nicotiana tabacum TaxID=4097 RepID=A0A1S3YLU8_TOBAC